MPKKPKKAPEPVPTQDETQFKPTLVETKPKMKKKDIFEDMTDSQKKRSIHTQKAKARLKEGKAKKKNSSN